MALISNLVARLSLDYGPFEKGAKRSRTALKEIKQDTAALAKQLAVLGGSAYAFKQVVDWTARIAREINDVGEASQRLNMTTQSLSRLQYAARITGMQTQEMNHYLEFLQRKLGEAALGSNATEAAFTKMGLSATKLANIPMDQALSAIARGLASVNSSAERAAIATQLFGRDSGQMVDLLDKGGATLAKLAAEAEKYGAVIRPDQVITAKEYAESVNRVTEAFSSLGRNIAEGLFPVLEKTLKLLNDIVVGANFVTSGKWAEDLVRGGEINAVDAQIAALEFRLKQGEGRPAIGWPIMGGGVPAIPGVSEQERKNIIREIEQLRLYRQKLREPYTGQATVGLRAQDTAAAMDLRAQADKGAWLEAMTLEEDRPAMEAAQQARARALGDWFTSLEMADQAAVAEYGQRTRGRALYDWLAGMEIAEQEQIARYQAQTNEAIDRTVSSMEREARTLEMVEAGMARTREKAELILDLRKAYPNDPARQEEALAQYRRAAANAEGLRNLHQQPGQPPGEQVREVRDLRAELERFSQIERLVYLAEDLGRSFAQAFEDMIMGARSAGQAIEGLTREITALVVRYSITEPIAKWISGSLGQAFGVGQYMRPGGGVVLAEQRHRGGMVGYGGDMALAPAAAFANARRYHFGLGADEFPAILQRGELVLPKGLAGMASAGAGEPKVTVNITNRAPGRIHGTPSVKYNQALRQFVLGVVLDEEQSNPAFRGR